MPDSTTLPIQTCWESNPRQWITSRDTAQSLKIKGLPRHDPLLLKRFLANLASLFSTFQLNNSIYEVYKPKGTPRVQIVFFHGIYSRDSTHFSTWENEDGSLLWPEKWLSKDFPDARILIASYNGDVGKGSCASNDMHNIVENLMTDIVGEDVGQIPDCPVVLVGHCVGGLVIKELCLKARNSSVDKEHKSYKKHKNFLDNLGGLFFYATPHLGFVPSKFVEKHQSPLFAYFSILNKDAARLSYQFHHLRRSYRSWEIRGLGERLPTNSSLFPKDEVAVSEASSREGDNFCIVTADHISISRPSSIRDKRFYFLKWMMDNIVADQLQSPVRKVASDELNEQEDGDAAQLRKYFSFLSDFGHPVTQEKAAKKLRSLCENKQDHAIKLVEEDGAVNILFKCLKDGRPRLQERVAWIFERLSEVGSFVSRVTNEVIVELVECLSKDRDPSLQEAAAWTLCHLVAIDGHVLEVVRVKEDVARMFKVQGAIVLLVKCLLKQEREEKWTDLREAAAYTLGNLAKLGDQYIVAAKEAKAIDRLEECLLPDNKPDLDKAAKYALGNLGQEMRTIADPGKSSSKYAGPVAQDSAPEDLCSIAEKGDDSIVLRMVEEDGAIAGLVKWLSKGPLLQERAAYALYYLTKRKITSIGFRVAKEEGAILGLMTCLSEHADPDVQEIAAWTLCDLFDKEQNDTIRSSIVEEDRAIVELVKWLSNSTNPGLQEAAAWNLCHLTEIDDDHGHSIKSRIDKEVGATTGLVKCLSRNNPTDLRKAAAYTLGNLAKLGNQYIRVAKEAGAICGLKECSTAPEDSELRKAATGALLEMKITI